MFFWRFQRLDDRDHYSDQLLQQISDVFADGFGIKQGWGIEEVITALHRSTILALLMNTKNEIGGYALYSIPTARLNNTYLMWEDAICLRKHLQSKNLTSISFLRQVCSLFPDQNFGWIGGRTQNPLVFLRYAKLGSIFPFDQLYSSSEGSCVLNYLLQNIAEVKEVSERLNYVNGICQVAYPAGKLGDFDTQIKGGETFERSLKEWGFNREKGDAVITVVKLTHPIQANR